MKTIVLGILVMGLASSAFALDKTQLDDRIRSKIALFTAMQQNPSRRVPTNELAQAQGIIFLDQAGGGFVFDFDSGDGVALARDTNGNWSAAGFVSNFSASLGVQIGGTRDFIVILLMSPAAAQALKESMKDFGGEASGTGGSQQAGAEKTINSGPEVIVYSQNRGLYAGARIKGGSISADKNANAIYYGSQLTMDDILFQHQVKPTQATAELIAKIEQFSR